ncbi:hypothetical protein QN224_00925 [Sinorhizobium sp. 8-89]|uniref:hypothetical protein n=1 Tax=Sinorhizobium sp. 7-81 TaxID=3049087 RepID=UPI0024C421C8|nr:hypothetical protein [Sinorhizobium sp. 7-81]MDK1383967.1 hypothetical protein [Sinorhizobium sp. 7-81]
MTSLTDQGPNWRKLSDGTYLWRTHTRSPTLNVSEKTVVAARKLRTFEHVFAMSLVPLLPLWVFWFEGKVSIGVSAAATGVLIAANLAVHLAVKRRLRLLLRDAKPAKAEFEFRKIGFNPYRNVSDAKLLGHSLFWGVVFVATLCMLAKVTIGLSSQLPQELAKPDQLAAVALFSALNLYAVTKERRRRKDEAQA